MKQGLSLLLSLVYCTLSQNIFLKSATAQVTPDRTTNTTVNVNGNDFTINQGDRAGGNLFHSFSDFSVPKNGSAFFNNAADIVNIFSRVTGGNISSIDGLLGVNGTANLFLINPAGIIFGEGARLNIGGSFYGSTADSILFPDGEFSAIDTDNPPLITINAPIGLNFRDNPGDIINQSVAQNSTGDVVGLEVTPGNNLTLVGGELNFETGNLTARGGNIELGGLSAAGTVTFNNYGSLSFPEDVAQADVNLTNASNVDVSGTDGGSITINTRNLNLKAGDFGSSFIRSGITADSTSAEAQAGNISINATDNVIFDGGSVINSVNPGAVGNAGDVIITTGSLSLINGGQVDTSTFGQGNTGSVEINASDIIIEGDGTGISTNVAQNTLGNAGDINITANSLVIRDDANIKAQTAGEGNGGNINITAEDSISLDKDSSILSQATSNATGNGGFLKITTNNLSITEDSILSVDNQGQGNAGNITLEIDKNITIKDSRFISAEALENANGGNLTINATEFIIAFPNQNNDNIASADRGNGGNINITTTNVFFNRDTDSFSSLFSAFIIPSDTEIPMNIIESEQTFAPACQSDRAAGRLSGLTVKGKGGIPPIPTDPFDSDTILVDEQNTTPNLQTHRQYPDIKPIKTSIGDIYPARGIIKTEDGQVILTRYPTDNINTRTPHISTNCPHL